jgi:hypothetical protein
MAIFNMKTRIEQFTSADYPMIQSWWKTANEIAPELHMIPSTTYVMYCDDQPILSVSLIMTNIPLSWIDNFIGNPELKGPTRKECVSILLNHLSKVAKEYGKERLFCMSMNDKTTKRYIDLGFKQTANQISTFVKGVN